MNHHIELTEEERNAVHNLLASRLPRDRELMQKLADGKFVDGLDFFFMTSMHDLPKLHKPADITEVHRQYARERLSLYDQVEALITKFAPPAAPVQQPVDGTPITPEVLLAQARAFVSEHWGRFGFGLKLAALKGQNETLYHLVQSLVHNR